MPASRLRRCGGSHLRSWAWRGGAVVTFVLAVTAVGAAGVAALPPARYPAAVAALHRQAVTGDAQARYDLAIVLLCGALVPRDPASAGVWMALAAPQGHVGAQSVFGWQLMSATGMQRDDLHAVHWLQQAAEAGDTAAQNNLGLQYALGHGVIRDEAQAERWFRAAADKGAAAAARNLQILLGLPLERASAPAAASAHASAATPVVCTKGPRTISR